MLCSTCGQEYDPMLSNNCPYCSLREPPARRPVAPPPKRKNSKILYWAVPVLVVLLVGSLGGYMLLRGGSEEATAEAGTYKNSKYGISFTYRTDFEQVPDVPDSPTKSDGTDEDTVVWLADNPAAIQDDFMLCVVESPWSSSWASYDNSRRAYASKQSTLHKNDVTFESMTVAGEPATYCRMIQKTCGVWGTNQRCWFMHDGVAYECDSWCLEDPAYFKEILNTIKFD